jgi:hypothetical protein
MSDRTAVFEWKEGPSWSLTERSRRNPDLRLCCARESSWWMMIVGREKNEMDDYFKDHRIALLSVLVGLRTGDLLLGRFFPPVACLRRASAAAARSARNF